jgi:ubiquinone/menaquinone biosynthesis C-methylase UbiE
MTEVFDYETYQIPVDLVNLTGGGIDTWHEISVGHMLEYSTYCPIEPDHSIVEVGCGVGRDAIQLTKMLSSHGRYLGVDIIAPSIRWCQDNITQRHPNFRFAHFDVKSQIHNSNGVLSTRDIRLPVPDASVDRVILQSVFTHMFEDDIVHYLKEFRRILHSDGAVFASVFLTDDASLAMAKETGQTLTFPFVYGDDCRINDERFPEGAVGYTEEALARMAQRGGMRFDQPIHRGFWCGRQGVTDGQDICILVPDRVTPPTGSARATVLRGVVDRLLRRNVGS